MTGPQEFRDRVRTGAQGSPYAVVDTATGFDVRMDVADARWSAPLYEQGLTRSFTHHVKLDPAARTYQVTDDVYQVSWQRGVSPVGLPVPVLRRSAQRTIGRVNEVSVRRAYSRDEHGHYRKQSEVSFDSARGRGLINDAARETGWTEREPGVVRAVRYFAVASAMLGLLVVVALLVALVLR